MKITAESKTLGASIEGYDLSIGAGDSQRDLVERLLGEHGVLCFRNQRLSALQLRDFSAQFGELEINVANTAQEPDAPEVMTLSNIVRDGKPIGLGDAGQGWHTDMSYSRTVAFANVLHALKVPHRNGQALGATQFSDMAAAYDALPDAEKEELDGVGVVHSWELSRDNIGRTISEWEKRDAPPMTHPLARPHPDTGRKALFMGMHASHLDGMPMEEGRARILELEAHSTQPQFLYRHTWKKGDVLMWDNRCLLHHADANFDAATHPRVLHRTCLRGTATGWVGS